MPDADGFLARFNIQIPIEEARERFLARVKNELWDELFRMLHERDLEEVRRRVVSSIGKRYYGASMASLVGDEFWDNVRAVQALYDARPFDAWKKSVSGRIEWILDVSEVDIGIRWSGEKFLPSGVELLDAHLVNDVLHWLRGTRLESVLNPFEKALDHLLRSQRDPKFLADVVTDCYEALEALARVVTERPGATLSATRELFISKVKASDEYKQLLKLYIDYAHDFRHAEDDGKPRPKPEYREVESFAYLTGLFVRFAMP